MKKILFASTALVATAGVAAAELTIDGSARFGLAYQENADTAAGVNSDTRIEQRMRVNITGIAETDAGVKLEARFRLESNENPNSGIAGRGPGAAGFAVSYGGLRVDVGNVSNVLDSGDQVDLYGYGVGLTGIVEQDDAFTGTVDPTVGFDAGGKAFTTVKVRYNVGDFSASLSYIDDKSVAIDANQYQLGLGYTLANGMSIGAVYSDTEAGATSVEHWVIGLNGTAGALGYSVIVADSDLTNFDTVFGASINYEVSSATAIQFAVSDGGLETDTAYGLGFTHGLGGGVTLAGGVGSNTSGNTVADLGVKFNF